MKMLACAAVAIWLVHPSFGQDIKNPLPIEADIRKAERSIKDLFAADYKNKERGARRKFAQKLLDQAAGTKELAEQFVLLRDARDVSAEALDFDTSFAASAKLSELFSGVSPLTGASFTMSLNKLESLNISKKVALGPDEAHAVAVCFLKLAEESIRASELEIASKAVQGADQLAKTSNDISVSKKTAELSKELPLLKAEYEAAMKAEAASEKGEGDAISLWGKYVLFAKGDTEKGLQILSKAGDPGLRNAAFKEGLKPGAEGALESADAWWVLSEKEKNVLDKKRYQNRAKKILDRALADSTGLVKSKLEKRMDDMERVMTGLAPVDLLELVDMGKDKVEGVWQMTGQGLLSPMHADFVSHRMGIPYTPPEEYDITAVIEKRAGFWTGIGIVAGGMQIGTIGSPQITCDWPVGKPVTVVIEVRKDGYKVRKDGKTLVDWKGDWKTATGLGAGWKVSSEKSLLLMSGGSYLYSKLVLKPISSPGRRLRIE